MSENVMPENAGKMEHFGGQIGEICHDEDEDGFNDFDVVREAGDEGRQKAPDDSHEGAAQRYDEEGCHPGEVVDRKYAFLASFLRHLGVSLEHVVQNLQ